MSVKYFCDLCGKEVDNQLVLTTLSIEGLNLERSLAFKGRNPVSLDGWIKEICGECRATVVSLVSDINNWPVK